MTTSDGRKALIEVTTQLLARGGLPETTARSYAASHPELQDMALPIAAACQRAIRQMQEPLDQLNALLSESGSSIAEWAAGHVAPEV